MKRRRRDLHTVLLPAGVLFVAFVVLLLTTKDGPEQRIMLIQMATGTAVLAAAWLLLDSRLDRITMAAEGFDGNVKRLEDHISEVSDRVEEVRQIPAIRRILVAQAEQRARESIGGPDTPQPGDPTMPDFPPEPFTRSPVR